MTKFVTAAVFVSLIPFAASAHPEESFRRTVTAQGQGKVQAVPDVATIRVEVTEEGPALDAVASTVRKKMQKVMDTLKSQQIAEKDMQTDAYQVQPKFEADKRGNGRRAGFIVLNRVSVKIRDLQKVGKILSAVVDAGANNVNGPDFEVDQPQKLEREALKLAVEDARAKAQILAQAAGTSLGSVQTITPMGGPVYPMPKRAMLMRGMAMNAVADTEAISAGEQTITTDVQVTFELK